MKVTKELKQHMRRARRLGVRAWFAYDNSAGYPRANHRAELELAMGSGLDETRVTLPTDVTLRCYDDASKTATRGYGDTGYAMERYNALVAFLRVGDEVVFRFVAGDDSDAMRTAGLHQDWLLAEVTRGNRVYELHVDNRVAPNGIGRIVWQG